MVRTGRGGGVRQADRLRHGRHLDRCVALCRGLRADLRDRGGGRPDAGADDGHPHGGGGRRLDLPVPRRAVPGRPGKRRGRSGAGRLPPRRAADGDRLQRDAGPAEPGAFPGGVRARRRRSRWTARRCGAGFAALAGEIAAATGETARPPEEIAEGFLRIAVDNMANAIKKISVQRGHDVTALHPAMLRRRRRPACLRGGRCAGDGPGAGASLCRGAVGLRHGAGRHPGAARAAAGPAVRGRSTRPRAAAAALEDEARAEVAGQGLSDIRCEARAHLRYEGSHQPLEVAFGDRRPRCAPAFEAAHLARFGFTSPERAVQIEMVAVEAIGGAGAGAALTAGGGRGGAGGAAEGAFRRLARGAALRPRRPARRAPRSPGPAIIAEPTGTNVVAAGLGRRGSTAQGNLILERTEPVVRAGGGRDGGRSGAAGGLQQPLHVGRRPDGGDAGQYLVVGEHQGALRFLLRDLRRGGRSGGQRAACAGASGLDVGLDPHGDAAQRRRDRAGAMRSC